MLAFFYLVLGDRKKHILYINYVYVWSDKKSAYIQSKGKKYTTYSKHRCTYIWWVCALDLCPYDLMGAVTLEFSTAPRPENKNIKPQVQSCKPHHFGIYNCAVFVLTAGHILGLRGMKPFLSNMVNSLKIHCTDFKCPGHKQQW